MARSSKKTVETILAVASATTTTTKEDFEVQRKITLATEGFTTTKFCELILRDRSRLSKESALTISEYIIAMKREVNPRLSYIKYTIQFLYEVSKSVGVEVKVKNLAHSGVSMCYYFIAYCCKAKLIPFCFFSYGFSIFFV
jgi:hypothetical protein